MKKKSSSNPNQSFRAKRTIAAIFIGLVVFITLAWNKPLYHYPDQINKNFQITAQPSSTLQAKSPALETDTGLTPSPTPLPQEWIENSENTNNIILVGVLLVVVVIGGTFRAILHNKQASPIEEE